MLINVEQSRAQQDYFEQDLYAIICFRRSVWAASERRARLHCASATQHTTLVAYNHSDDAGLFRAFVLSNYCLHVDSAILTW
jgi:hypothetical protein